MKRLLVSTDNLTIKLIERVSFSDASRIQLDKARKDPGSTALLCEGWEYMRDRFALGDPASMLFEPLSSECRTLAI